MVAAVEIGHVVQCANLGGLAHGDDRVDRGIKRGEREVACLRLRRDLRNRAEVEHAE